MPQNSHDALPVNSIY